MDIRIPPEKMTKRGYRKYFPHPIVVRHGPKGQSSNYNSMKEGFFRIFQVFFA
jgi:hypothetical protein